MTRPTTCDAVTAHLESRADFRGIEERHRSAYLLGMCSALLAEANREITRLEQRLAALEPDEDDDEPCWPDGTRLYPRRKLTRQERLEGLVDSGREDHARGER